MRCPVSPQVEYRIPPYDIDAFLIEAELLLDWFLPRFGVQMPDEEREQFRALWREHLQPAIASPPTWVLRDFHSPNLLWLPRRTGIARLGILDFQDALMGPAAYDLASLLQDARIDVSEQTEVALLGRYVLARRQHAARFRPCRIHPDLRDAGGAARQQDPGHLRPSRHARRKAAIFASSSPHMGVPAALAGPSGAQDAAGVV